LAVLRGDEGNESEATVPVAGDDKVVRWIVKVLFGLSQIFGTGEKIDNATPIV
jgi:hypothetical protein